MPEKLRVRKYTALTTASDRHLSIINGYKGGKMQILYTEQQRQDEQCSLVYLSEIPVTFSIIITVRGHVYRHDSYY